MKKIIVFAISAFAFASAFAQSFPTKPIRIVVPYAASGTPDLLARILAEKLAAKYGVPVVVENKPGASGVISAQAVTSAPSDGYTLWIADNGQLAINPSLNKKLPYEPLRDFLPVVQMVSQPFFIYAQTSLGAKTVPELIAIAKAKPGVLNYGSVGNGSPHHLCMAMLANLAGIQLVHIPFKSMGGELIPAMMNNEVSLTCTSPVTAAPMVNARKGVPLAVAAAQRSPHEPTIPTFSEATGLGPLVVGATIGVLVKAGTSPAIVETLSRDISEALRTPAIEEKLRALGMSLVDSSPALYTAQIREEQERYGRMVKSSGATLD